MLVGCTTQTSALDVFFTTRVKKMFRSDGRTHELQSSCAHNCHWPESAKQRFSNFKRLNPDGKLRIHGNCGCGIFPQILRYDRHHFYLLHTHTKFQPSCSLYDKMGRKQFIPAVQTHKFILNPAGRNSSFGTNLS